MLKILRRIGSIVLAVTLGFATFAAIAIVGLSVSGSDTAAAVSPGRDSPKINEVPQGGQFVVAVVLGQSGSDTADVLAPYDVLASSPSFFVYTVSASTDPATVDGGLSIIPTHTFAEVASGAAPAPDLVVVPAVNSPAGPQEAAAREFIANQYQAGTRILGICAGSRMLAASGVLDGLQATSHWSRIAALKISNPEVSWVTGQRYVQDGRVTTTGGVTSSIPGTLRVMADMAGDAEAERVGESIGYPGWKLNAETAMPVQRFGLEDVAFLANTAFPWGRPNFAVELRDGVDEIDAAAIFEVYGYSQGATTSALSVNGFVTTKHGMVVKTSLLGRGKDTLVAGALGNAGSKQGFDAAFEQLSKSASSSVVYSVSKMIEYPISQVAQDVAPLTAQARTPLLLVVSLALAVGIAIMPSTIVRRVRRRKNAA